MKTNVSFRLTVPLNAQCLQRGPDEIILCMKNIGVASTQGPHPDMDRIVCATTRFVVAGGGKAVELA